jgi:glyoxylase-like metal-dependent hydrolase (beta-lactamase superfamily II)
VRQKSAAGRHIEGERFWGEQMGEWVDLGGIAVRSLVVSRFWVDGGSMFGQVPKALWNSYSKCDELNRIPLVVRSLLIRAPGALVLVDPGMGSDYSREEAEQLRIDPSLGDLARVLRGAGITPEKITHVLITHLHFDHVAGIGFRDGAGQLRPALPAARVYVQKAQWERAQHPGPKEKRSFRRRDLELLRELDLELVDGECEILPGITVRPTEGHTRAQQIVIVEGQRERVYYPADLIPTLAHIRAAYTMGFDLRPESVIEEKAALLTEAAAGNAIVVFEHDPLTAACRVKEGAGGFVVRNKERI